MHSLFKPWSHLIFNCVTAVVNNLLLLFMNSIQIRVFLINQLKNAPSEPNSLHCSCCFGILTYMRTFTFVYHSECYSLNESFFFKEHVPFGCKTFIRVFKTFKNSKPNFGYRSDRPKKYL